MPKERDIEHDKAETRRLILDSNRDELVGGVNLARSRGARRQGRGH